MKGCAIENSSRMRSVRGTKIVKINSDLRALGWTHHTQSDLGLLQAVSILLRHMLNHQIRIRKKSLWCVVHHWDESYTHAHYFHQSFSLCLYSLIGTEQNLPYNHFVKCL